MKKEQEERLIKYLRGLIKRVLVVIILFLVMAILVKKDNRFKDKIFDYVYKDNISFVKIKNLYNKYLGGIVPLDNITIDERPVFNEELIYSDASIYYDGVKLEVDNHYLVPVLKEGMVVYIGEKENYGNVIIIEGIDGINIWYGNMENTTVKLYDYVDASTYLGETKDDSLYLVYSSDGEFLNYEEYLP